jgi:hypothetical protein
MKQRLFEIRQYFGLRGKKWQDGENFLYRNYVIFMFSVIKSRRKKCAVLVIHTEEKINA